MSRTIEVGRNFVPNPERRRFLKNLLGVFAIAAGAGAVVGSIESAMNYFGDREALYDKPVEGRSWEVKVTDNYPDEKPILVRAEPNPNDENIIGWVEPGVIVGTRAWHGKVYPGINGLGEFEGADGESYGLWFKIVNLDVFVKNGDQVTKQAKHDVYIAGNFLRAATDEESADFYTSGMTGIK